MNTLQQQIVFAGASLLCAGIGAFHDVRERRIPNHVTVPAMAAGLILHWIAGGPRGLADSALAGLIAGAVFLIFFLAGGMGGGDVKLMAAVGCISGLSHLGVIVIATAIAGGVFAVAVSLYHRRLREMFGNVGDLLAHHSKRGFEPHPDLNLTNPHTLRLPFALPVAAGCLFVLCSLAWEAWS
jgi:prepilin peptidase CpaA